jgi:hypothetical protein
MNPVHQIKKPPPFFTRRGCVFLGDEGYVSYGDSSGTEISNLPWDEAVAVFRDWWEERREINSRQAEAFKRRAAMREVTP